MSFTRLAAIAVAVSAFWCAAASAGGPLRPFKHGFWSGGAYTDARTGAFTHCSAGVAYDSGINLFVLVTGGYRWWLGFINPNWSLTPNAKISIKLQLDDGTPFDGPASIPSGQLLLVSLPDSSKLLAAFRRSSKLALDAEGQSFSFKLNGTPAVMDQLASCVRASVALATPPAPSTPASAKTGVGGASSSPTQPGPSVTSEGPPAVPAGPVTPATGSSTPPQKADAETAVASHTLHAASEAAVAPSATGRAPLGNATATPPVSTAGPPTPPAETAAPPQPVASAVSGAERASDRAGEPATAALSSAPTRPAGPAGDKTEATAQPPLSAAAAPPLAFTSVAPAPSTPRSSATASELPPALATATALEEIRLATDFLTNARLRDARLIVAEKPPALADFTAVWRSEEAAGAVKIIPPGPDVSGIEIASNLIAVDPQVCKGDFSAARFRNDVDNSVVFSAVLSCRQANEQRVTEYFITPRHQGGFVVFAVIRSKAADKMPGFDWPKIEVLSKAAIQAAEGQG